LKALETIEAAQHQPYDAAELLSPVPGLAHEWEAVRDTAFTVKDRWKAVEAALRLVDSSSPSAHNCELHHNPAAMSGGRRGGGFGRATARLLTRPVCQELND
jgi:hypothetical protein